MQSTRSTQYVGTTPAEVYRALVDPVAVVRWRVPDGMQAVVHEWDPRIGGRFRVTLTYDAPDAKGKTTANTDTYGGRFASLVPGRRVVEVLAFESEDPELSATMTMTTTLTRSGAGTEVEIRHDGLPDVVPAADNEAGTRMALARLAALVEGSGESGLRSGCRGCEPSCQRPSNCARQR